MPRENCTRMGAIGDTLVSPSLGELKTISPEFPSVEAALLRPRPGRRRLRGDDRFRQEQHEAPLALDGASHLQPVAWYQPAHRR